ncbi:hypothetical protein M433DRAFT_153455 [Acidomyces richmondensis BFW]|nr:MAG: hypothetical protein FE78DRAFT_89095 [Acidomyces sp. 'richmondensis']KYG46384.1 hypothetical protein M433DRAFT_153455 [Acidomyces richmondensis BFW]
MRSWPSPYCHGRWWGPGRPDRRDRFPALHVPFIRFRGHICTLVTLVFEAVAKTAPQVSFIHDYPGPVYTPFMNRILGWKGIILRAYASIFGYWVCAPIEESGERHLFLAASGMYAPAENLDMAIPLGKVEVARGANGKLRVECTR